MSRDNETGRYQSEYSDEEILEAVKEVTGQITTGELCEALGCKQPTAYRRLNTLTDEGKLEHMKKGNTNLWMLE